MNECIRGRVGTESCAKVSNSFTDKFIGVEKCAGRFVARFKRAFPTYLPHGSHLKTEFVICRADLLIRISSMEMNGISTYEEQGALGAIDRANARIRSLKNHED